MRLTHALLAGLLVTVAGSAAACELPALVVIPPKENNVGKEESLKAAYLRYREAMQAFTQCVQADLTAAGGDAAAVVVKAALVQRNNAAVAEVAAMDKLFAANVGPIGDSAGPTPGAPEPEADHKRR
jgi:hypothetical protein